MGAYTVPEDIRKIVEDLDKLCLEYKKNNKI